MAGIRLSVRSSARFGTENKRKEGDVMPADARSSFDERIVGKFSLRSSLIALAVFLGFIWAIALGSIISKNQLDMTTEGARQSWQLWDVNPDSLKFRMNEGGFICEQQKAPDWQIGWTREELHGAVVRQ